MYRFAQRRLSGPPQEIGRSDVALIAIEEHWNLPALTSAVKALPEDRGDPSVLFDEMGDNLERLDDMGDARITAMDAQGVDPRYDGCCSRPTTPSSGRLRRTLSSSSPRSPLTTTARSSPRATPAPSSASASQRSRKGQRQ